MNRSFWANNTAQPCTEVCVEGSLSRETSPVVGSPECQAHSHCMAVGTLLTKGFLDGPKLDFCWPLTLWAGAQQRRRGRGGVCTSSGCWACPWTVYMLHNSKLCFLLPSLEKRKLRVWEAVQLPKQSLHGLIVLKTFPRLETRLKWTTAERFGSYISLDLSHRMNSAFPGFHFSLKAVARRPSEYAWGNWGTLLPTVEAWDKSPKCQSQICHTCLYCGHIFQVCAIPHQWV